MPRFFFHIRDGSKLIEDLEGVELSNIEAIEEEAVQAAREIMADRVRSGKAIDGQEFLVFDEAGAEVTQIPFKSALKD